MNIFPYSRKWVECTGAQVDTKCWWKFYVNSYFLKWTWCPPPPSPLSPPSLVEVKQYPLLNLGYMFDLLCLGNYHKHVVGIQDLCRFGHLNGWVVVELGCSTWFFSHWDWWNWNDLWEKIFHCLNCTGIPGTLWNFYFSHYSKLL